MYSRSINVCENKYGKKRSLKRYYNKLQYSYLHVRPVSFLKIIVVYNNKLNKRHKHKWRRTKNRSCARRRCVHNFHLDFSGWFLNVVCTTHKRYYRISTRFKNFTCNYVVFFKRILCTKKTYKFSIFPSPTPHHGFWVWKLFRFWYNVCSGIDNIQFNRQDKFKRKYCFHMKCILEGKK